MHGRRSKCATFYYIICELSGLESNNDSYMYVVIRILLNLKNLTLNLGFISEIIE